MQNKEILGTGFITPPSERGAMSRRDFLKKSVLLGSALVIGCNTNPDFKPESQNQDPQELLPFKSIEEEDKSVTTLLSPAIQACGLSVISSIFLRIASRKIQLGNPGFGGDPFIREVMENKYFRYSMLGFVAPVVEEWIFRYLPSEFILKGDPRQRWDVGIATSAAFALFHNLQLTKLPTLKAAPIVQFGMGLFFWKRQRETGYLNAVVAHSIYNLSSKPVYEALNKLEAGKNNY